MTASKRALGSDLAKVDAHEISPEEYDEVPELTEELIERADVYQGDRMIKAGRGRPKSATPKRLVTIRLDQDVLEGLRSSGPGWQSRANEALRQLVKKASAR